MPAMRRIRLRRRECSFSSGGDVTPGWLRYRITVPDYPAYRTIMIDRAGGVTAVVGLR